MSYPAPAFLLFAPLAPFPVDVARAMYVALGVGVFAYLVTARRPQLVPLLFAYPLLESTVLGQWSPLLAASLFVPAFQILFAGKPTIGAALWLSRPSCWPLGAGIVLVAVSLLLLPSWIPEWLSATTFTPYFVLACRPGGFVLLLALLRWRRPEARVLLGMALIPHTTISYEALYVMLAAETRFEATLLVLLSYADPLADYFQLRAPLQSYGERVARTGTLLVWVLYVPTLIMILRRPNIGEIPTSVERVSTWLALRIRSTKSRFQYCGVR